MASLSSLQEDFSAGMKRDFSRDAMPKGSLYNAVDVIPSLSAKLRERGGWSYASNDIAATYVGADFVETGVYAPFSAASKNLAVAVNFGVDIHLVSIAANGTVTDIGAIGFTPLQVPVFHRDKIILTHGTGTSSPKTYDGTTLAALGGTPPTARWATVFKDRTVMANSSTNTNRVWFSGAGNPASWDTTNSWWDFTYPITGLASTRGAILIFHEGHFSTLVGSIPPTVAGGSGDFRANDPLFDVGCEDVKSIANYGDKVIFANQEGIFVTDGATYEDLTALTGMTNYWRDLLANNVWSDIVGSVYRNYYFYSITNSAGTGSLDAGMIDLRRLAWWRLSNVDARAMWKSYSGTGGAGELYFGRAGTARVGKMSSIFMPSSTVKNDGNGTAVAATIETPFYQGRNQATIGWRRAFTGYYLQDYATDNPTVAVSYVKTPESTSYTTAATLVENTAQARPGVSMGFSSRGIGLKLARANAGDFQLAGIYADAHSREGSR